VGYYHYKTLSVARRAIEYLGYLAKYGKNVKGKCVGLFILKSHYGTASFTCQ
jgi:hypothetical protein